MTTTPESDAETAEMLPCNCYDMESTKHFREATGESVHWVHCQINSRPAVSAALAARDAEIAGLRAQTGFDFAAFVARKMAHSLSAFGPDQRPSGVADHIRKELLEIEADPDDKSEWIDVLLLAIDGASRAGLSPAEIVTGLQEKLAKNEARAWPDWRKADTSKAIEHIGDAKQGDGR